MRALGCRRSARWAARIAAQSQALVQGQLNSPNRTAGPAQSCSARRLLALSLLFGGRAKMTRKFDGRCESRIGEGARTEVPAPSGAAAGSVARGGVWAGSGGKAGAGRW